MPETEPKCSVCGKELDSVKPCGYNRRGFHTCDECCEECYKSEPFPCREYEERRAAASADKQEGG